MLDIIASYHCMNFQEKLMNQTWENGKKPSFGQIWALLAQIWAPNFLSWILLLPYVRHYCKLSFLQFQAKLMNQTWENVKKLSFGAPLAQIWPAQKFFMDFIPTAS